MKDLKKQPYQILMNLDLQLFGGRGATSGLPTASPSGGDGGGQWSKNALNTENPETLRQALGTRGKPMSIENAVKGANPYYDGTYKEFSENCQRAVAAYEARRRGYNVTAQPTFKGDNLSTAIPTKTGYNGIWQGAFQKAKSENVSGSNPDSVRNNVEKKMQQYGDGSRAVLMVQWKGGGGHALNVERKNGKTHYVDAQIGAKYNSKELFNAIKPKETQIVRTDNLKFSDRMKKSVEQAGARTNTK